MSGLDTGNVISWSARPQRIRKPPPKSYWEEYVETDEWYLSKLLEDVPADEVHAACFDDDVDEDVPSGDDDDGPESGTDDESFADAASGGDPESSEYTSSDSESTHATVHDGSATSDGDWSAAEAEAQV
jgi:hypothetical protein|tara:strand:+ start:1203 stop:1589 length:387 start_codon:yes stop_codon:yes gene_type:complete